MPERLLVTLDDAAVMLSLSRRSTQELVYAGELPSIKIGRSRRIPTEDLAAYVERRRNENGVAPSPQLQKKTTTTAINSGRQRGRRASASRQQSG